MTLTLTEQIARVRAEVERLAAIPPGRHDAEFWRRRANVLYFLGSLMVPPEPSTVDGAR